jgi:tungstate transport system ATP-binding protein
LIIRHRPSLLPLELHQVGFTVRGARLLGPLSLRLTHGPVTVVLGPNGAGKSLLMRLCHGLLVPTAGEIRLPRGLTGPQARATRLRQAMVFQRPVLLRRSALRNVTYALAIAGISWTERRRRAEAALERFGLRSIARRHAHVLSGGEQQRLALARAWALDPELLFLDEPTASLDPPSVMAFEAALAAFRERGTKIVMATHDLAQARRLADEVIFLSRGQVLECSPSGEFFMSPRHPQARAFLQGEIVG